MQAANLTNFRVTIDFIVLLLVKVGGHLSTDEKLCNLPLNRQIRVGTYRPEAALLQCKQNHSANIVGTPGKLFIPSVLRVTERFRRGP
jgi:hypothetical protein